MEHWWPLRSRKICGTRFSSRPSQPENIACSARLVVDNRADKADELMEIEAVTVTGRSQMIERGGDFDQWAGLLIARHPYLKSFVKAATCALFRVDVARFLHVARFQEVSQWIPTARS